MWNRQKQQASYRISLVQCLVQLNQKQQAFVEMEDQAAAAKVLGHYQTTPCVVRGRNVQMQYSQHERIVIKADSSKVRR